ncbi:immunity 50 family protein [Kitasatospora sp. NBC_01287]|uniref:Imm50 family immunity protein n=1 Tax=Kitasatospora sp. NBC_01287 TaxID=2903573 RepID=UPI002255DE8E|nr:Imm50 family immunity protein [Kitasatospora sp. NBC_01287]MCX4750557.1 immunity 50 family protein [Kitasatospora sp. NBC_01287]
MAVSDWTDHVSGAADLVQLFYGAPPLAELEFMGVLIDERVDCGLTLGFDTSDIPGADASSLFVGGQNALEFFVVFSGVSKLTVSGWDHTGLQDYGIRTVESGSIQVSLAGETWHITFLADSCRIEGIRAYRAAIESR